jgi:drug/metabolite transporter (DMT)-like permease
MKELVTTEQAARVIVLFAIALPIAGLIIGAVAGAARKRLASSALLGLICGLVGPVIWVMWQVYNGIMGRYGLDSVKGLLINLGLFLVVGLAAGLAVGGVWRRLRGAGGAPAAGRGKS